MYYEAIYESPLGDIRLVADETELVSLSLPGQRHFIGDAESVGPDEECAPLDKAFEWLDTYFAGKDPGFNPPLRLTGTNYQNAVCRLLMEIPYGQTITYKEIAVRLAEERGTKPASHPVGQAASHNPIALIVPCHRVVGTNGSLTGYSGGIEKKVWLLEHEGADMSNLKMPRIRKSMTVETGSAAAEAFDQV